MNSTMMKLHWRHLFAVFAALVLVLTSPGGLAMAAAICAEACTPPAAASTDGCCALPIDEDAAEAEGDCCATEDSWCQPEADACAAPAAEPAASPNSAPVACCLSACPCTLAPLALPTKSTPLPVPLGEAIAHALVPGAAVYVGIAAFRTRPALPPAGTPAPSSQNVPRFLLCHVLLC